jgi:4'-phosphopantetheinyl transferase
MRLHAAKNSAPLNDIPTVVVFYSAVATSLDATEVMFDFLNDEEQWRARRFVFEQDRHLFITAHALLHYSLCLMGRDTPRHFTRGRYGKPELVPAPGRPTIKFNLTHSGSLTLCAVSKLYDVGIDIEVIREFDFGDIASSYFAQSEQALLAAVSPVDRADRFFQLWTLKEAVTKAIGKGLSTSLSDVAFALEPLSLQASFERLDDRRAWHIEQRRLLPLHWSALAVRCGVNMSPIVQWQSVSPMELIGFLQIERALQSTISATIL